MNRMKIHFLAYQNNELRIKEINMNHWRCNMKKPVMIIWILVMIMSFSGILFGDNDKVEVERVITNAYFNGAFNDLDTESMKKGFHPDFAIFSAKGKEMSRYPIAIWIERTEKRKNDPGFDPAQVARDCRITSLDVTGGCATAKVEIFKKRKLVYTDYLSLLKFDDGWKIVAKVYHSHKH